MLMYVHTFGDWKSMLKYNSSKQYVHIIIVIIMLLSQTHVNAWLTLFYSIKPNKVMETK